DFQSGPLSQSRRHPPLILTNPIRESVATKAKDRGGTPPRSSAIRLRTSSVMADSNQRYLIAFGVVKFAVDIIIHVLQLRDIGIADRPRRGSAKDRGLIGGARGEVVEEQIQRDRQQCRRADPRMEDRPDPGRELIIKTRQHDRDGAKA